MVAPKQKKRGRENRLRTRFVVIGAEGNNKTEKIYFAELLKPMKSYKAKFVPGQATDPVGMVKEIIKYMDSAEISNSEGDLAYCIIDTDTNKEKQFQIDNAKKLANDNGITVIVSNPIFEVWYLQHFRYSTRQFSSNLDLIRELKNYIPNYTKNMNVYDDIKSYQSNAISNAKKLDNYHDNLKNEKELTRNPSTNVYKIIEDL